jgi:hypothetical protein
MLRQGVVIGEALGPIQFSIDSGAISELENSWATG